MMGQDIKIIGIGAGASDVIDYLIDHGFTDIGFITIKTE